MFHTLFFNPPISVVFAYFPLLFIYMYTCVETYALTLVNLANTIKRNSSNQQLNFPFTSNLILLRLLNLRIITCH